MTLRILDCATPGVEAVPAQEEAVNLRMPIEHATNFSSQPQHVLIIPDDRQPFAMRVRADAVEALQHFEAFDGDAFVVSVEIREYGAPNGMGVQDSLGAPCLHDFEMDQRLGRWAAASTADDRARLVHLEKA